MAIWYILWSCGIVLVFCTKKNLSTLLHTPMYVVNDCCGNKIALVNAAYEERQ
jgi:hypothetical protein